MQPNRSFLFTPGNHPRKVAKVFHAGADAAILDLEDAVAVAEKPATRGAVAEALQAPRPCRGYVRINALDTPFAFEDLQAVIAPGLDGIVVPKVETPEQMATVAWVVGELERVRGLRGEAIDIIPIIETARGVANARAILSATSRLRRITFGAGDYTRDMGLTWTRDEAELAHARAELVLASRLAGLEPPCDTVWVDLSDAEGLAASARRAQEMGFQGKFCIHPGQIGPVHEVFTPSDAEVARARRIVSAFAEAEATGSASIQVDGQFVDYPIVARAERTLALARAVSRDAAPEEPAATEAAR